MKRKQTCQNCEYWEFKGDGISILCNKDELLIPDSLFSLLNDCKNYEENYTVNGITFSKPLEEEEEVLSNLEDSLNTAHKLIDAAETQNFIEAIKQLEENLKMVKRLHAIGLQKYSINRQWAGAMQKKEHVSIKQTEKPKGANINPKYYKIDEHKIADYIYSNNMSYAIGSAIKCVIRHEHSGNPKRDLEKALWYIDFAIENPPKGLESIDVLDNLRPISYKDFCRGTGLKESIKDVISYITWASLIGIGMTGLIGDYEGWLNSAKGLIKDLEAK